DRQQRLNSHDLAHAVRISAAGLRLLGHRGFLSLAAFSAAFLNAASASSQNPSTQPGRASIGGVGREQPSCALGPNHFRCWETAGRLTSIPSAISLTERVPFRRRLNTRRRVRSPRASRAHSTLGTILLFR